MSAAIKPRVIIPLLLVVGLLLYYLFFNPVPQRASFILVNGVVYTVNDEEPKAEAIAIRDGRIVGVGSTDAIKASFQSDRVVDLKGRPVYPGFIDSHAHLEGLGALLRHLDLTLTTSPEEILGIVAREVPKTPPGVWIRGLGWDQNRWRSERLPTSSMLDKVSPDVPVYLRRIDGHAVWVNGAAMKIAGISASTPGPERGTITRDARGNPTGVFLDNAIALLDSLLPVASEVERMSAIEAAIQGCVQVGLTGVHDMGTDLTGVRLYKELIRAGRFPFRVYVAVDGLGAAWDHYKAAGPEINTLDNRLTVRAVGLSTDGFLQSGTAALIEPYNDDSGNRGQTFTSTEALERIAREALGAGFQLCVDAVGDRANNIVLDVYEKVLNSNKMKDQGPRFRVEYVQVLDSNDIPRFRRLGVLPVLQPSQVMSGMHWVEDRLGSKRASRAWAWRSLLDAGSITPTGSDSPVENPNPLWGFYAAITRQDLEGKPEEGWHPEQRMTREEALKGCTLWAAYAGFEEQEKGTIEKGKLADLVVLTDDIMRIPPRDILSCRVEATIIAGEIVYSSPAFAETLASLGR